MLKAIHIRDFAIVAELDLELGEGMNALTGETGAGKSILLDALGLCLGDRATADTVRPGAERAEITALFELAPGSAAAQWLAEREMAVEEEVAIRRVVQAQGRSRGYINGAPVALQMLRELGELLVDIHGQHAHQSLLRPAAQRALLDAYAGAEGERGAVRDAYQRLTAIDREIGELEGAGQGYEERLELLRHQVEELEAAEPSSEGIAALEAEHQRLAHADELIRTAHSQLQALCDDEGAAQAALGRAIRELGERRHLDPALGEAVDLLETALAHLEEGSQVLRGFADGLESDPQRLAELEQRIAELRDLARKHHVAVEALPQTLEELRTERHRLENAGERLEELRAERGEALAAYQRAAAALSSARAAAGERLAAAVGELLGELGMAGAELIPAVEHEPDAQPGPEGLDRVELRVRTNPGQPAGPLSKVASGGELSRLGLAIQVATVARSQGVATLVFDEADAGIGGAVAEVVGRLLSTLGRRYQVLCVTHLPQVAAQAAHHFQVHKAQGEAQTHTRVAPLSEPERIEEIARMLGGLEITDHERGAARELIERGRGSRA